MTQPHRTIVGFGFGPIQSGLFLYEAFQTGLFRRLVVAEVVPDVVRKVRAAGGYNVNIATLSGIRSEFIPGVEILDPAQSGDREALLQAIGEATDISTALPSVDFFDRGGPSAPAGILAEGLALKSRRGRQPAVIFTGENHIHAAELLAAAIERRGGPADMPQLCQCLNTVIGKMSQIVSDPEEIRTRRLSPSTPDSGKAFLVEEFNRILISRITLRGYTPAIRTFMEKDDLSLFEETKLYGHNAVHAMSGYLLHTRRCAGMAEMRNHPDLMATAREALVAESGAALRRKYAGADPLATEAGFQDYADDLLPRMVNPWLGDTVNRVIRDPARKLGWDDRLIGAMRLCLSQGILPRRLAAGAVEAMRFLAAARNASDPAVLLETLWQPASPDPREKAAVLDTLREAARSAAPAAP